MKWQQIALSTLGGCLILAWGALCIVLLARHRGDVSFEGRMLLLFTGVFATILGSLMVASRTWLLASVVYLNAASISLLAGSAIVVIPLAVFLNGWPKIAGTVYLLFVLVMSLMTIPATFCSTIRAKSVWSIILTCIYLTFSVALIPRAGRAITIVIEELSFKGFDSPIMLPWAMHRLCIPAIAGFAFVAACIQLLWTRSLWGGGPDYS